MSNLGQSIRQYREQLGLSLDALSAELRIPLQSLQALENGDFQNLPGQVYTRAYLISLSKKFQLNPQELLELYVRESGHSAPTPTKSNSQLLNFNTNGASLKAQKNIPFTPIFIVVLLLLALFVALKLALRGPAEQQGANLSSDSMNPAESQIDSLAIAAQTSANQNVKDSSLKVLKPETRISVLPKSAESAILRIRFNEDSVSTKIIRKGNEPFNLTSSDTVELKISYPNRAELQLNDSIVPSIPRGKYFKVFNGNILE